MGGGGHALLQGIGAQGQLVTRSALQLAGFLVAGVILGSMLTSMASQQNGNIAADVAAIKQMLGASAGHAAHATPVIDIPLLAPQAAAPAGPRYIANQLAARNVSFDGHELTILALQNDEYVGAAILATGLPFEPETLQLMLDNVKPGTTVVDAGCNFGSYSIFFASKVGPGGRVHCFEPQRKMAQLANANSLVNGLSSVMRVHNLALSFAAGTVEMAATLPDGSSAGQSMNDIESKHGAINYGGMKLGKGGEPAAAVTLDSLDLDNISFMKIDVQGAEQLMLYGAQDTIRRNLPVVVYEHLAGWNVTQDMIERMKIPKEVLAWSIDDFFKGLGYTPRRTGIEVMQTPPAKRGRRAASRKLA